MSAQNEPGVSPRRRPDPGAGTPSARRFRRALTVFAVLAATGLLAGCGLGGGAPQVAPPAEPPSAPPSATAVPAPPLGACYRLAWSDALSPTHDGAPVDCDAPHTARTFAVGELDDLSDGHLLAVDSARVQQRVARTCPARLAEYLGGSEQDRRLSMLRSVWFTPSVEDSEAGARWYRCEVVAVAADERLARLPGSVRGVLATPEGRERYGMCATAAPDDPGFRRVICSAAHTWRAIAAVDLDGRRYPGRAAARDAGQQRCEDAGRDAAEDPLSFQWGYEWPTREQWAAGQTFGRCWAPDAG